MQKLKVEYVPIASIKPYEGNAKKHPQEQIDQIKKSIELMGFENFLFYILAFYPAFSMAQIVSMGLATCLLECIIGIADTPFLYLARALKHGDEADV